MSQNFENYEPIVTGTSYSWSEVWVKALTSPYVDTYEDILLDPQATAQRAYIWTSVSYFIAIVLTLAVQSLFGSELSRGLYGDLGIGFLICFPPVAVVLWIIGFTLYIGLIQGIASVLGGTGSFSKLAYAFAAYYSPLMIISAIIGSIPFVNCLSLPLGIYGLVLNVTAVKAVNGFGWGRAIVASFALLAVVLVLVMCIVVLALLGPGIEGVFQNIIDSIGTPMP